MRGTWGFPVGVYPPGGRGGRRNFECLFDQRGGATSSHSHQIFLGKSSAQSQYRHKAPCKMGPLRENPDAANFFGQSGNSPFRCGLPSRRKKPSKKIELTREKRKHPPKAQKTPPTKARKTPLKDGGNTKFSALTREKKLPSFKK